MTAHRKLRSIVRYLARAMAMVLACALVVAVVRAGQTYFVCAPMGVFVEHPCCAAAKCKKECKAAPSLERSSDCCQPFALDDVRVVHASPSPNIAAAPCLGIVPRQPWALPYLAGALHTTSEVARAGPPRRPTPSFLRVYLI